MLNVIDEFTHESWRSVSLASSKQSMSSTFCPTCSSCAAFPVTFGPTTDLSSSPRPSKLGSPLSAPRLPISSGAALGRTATSRASTPAFAMSCSMARSSTPSREAQIVIESWRRHYNTIRPHASLGYKPPAPEVFLPAFAAWPAALPRPAPPATLAQRPTLN
jgi:hypothetical protein